MLDKNSLYAPAEVSRWQSIALGIGAIATIICVVGYFTEGAEQFLRSWLLGFIFWGGISIGSIGVLMLQYLTGGAWGVVIRRILEAGSRTIWIAPFFILPIILNISTIYHWSTAAGDQIVEWRSVYLNPWSFAIRTLVYFILWFTMAYLLNKWSEKQDASETLEDAAEYLEKPTRFSGPTMVIFALVVSFAAIDWVMTLDKHWFSTIWGMLYLVGWGLSTFAFVIALLANLLDKEPFSRIIGKKHFHDIGKLMLALVMVWTYFNLSQYLIIYSGNIPEETPWYLTRISGGWQYVGLLLLFFHFVFPFLLLLSRDIKRNSKWLSTIAVLILVMRIVDSFYHIGPQPMAGGDGHGSVFHISWTDFVAPIAIGGLWLAFFFYQLKKRPLLPYKDPFVENAIKHGQGH